MRRFRLTASALRDLDDIASYSLLKWGPGQTERYIATLYERMQWLAENPMLGRARDDVGAGTRSFQQGSHVIFYTVVSDEIAVIGIPHGSMDVDAYFERREKGE